MKTNKTLRCDDADADPRVDREGCRLLGIRSIIASPVRSENSVIGLVEVFSPRRNAFGPGQEKIIERLAEMIGAFTDRRQEAGRHPANSKDSEHQPEHLAAIAVEPPPIFPEALPAAEASTVAATPRFERLEAPFQFEQMLEDKPRPWRTLLFVTLGVIVLLGTLWFVASGGSTNRTVKRGQSETSDRQNSSRMATSTPGDFQSLSKLAANGDPNAQFDMGAHYATGDGVKQDYAESVRWFTLAAEQGHVIAQATLGAYYWAGRGIPQDLEKAYFWSAVAQAGGDAASRYRVTVLTSRMPHNQVVVAQQHADEWLKKHDVPLKSAD